MISNIRFMAGAFLTVLLIANGSRADEKDAAKKVFEEGVELFKQERYEEAAEAFKKANALNPSWKLQYNIGQCEASSGRYGLAMEAFQRYLVEGADDVPSDRKEYVLEETRRLKELVGYLQVEAEAESEVYVDKVLRGRTPLLGPVMVEASKEHDLEVRGPKGEVYEKKFVVWSGKEIAIETNFDEPTSEETPREMGPSSSQKATPDDADGKRRGLKPVWFWVGVGTTAALGGTTLGLNLAVHGKRDELAEDEVDKYEIMQAVGIGFLAATAAAAIATGVLAIFTDFKGEKDKSLTVGVAPDGLILVGRF